MEKKLDDATVVSIITGIPIDKIKDTIERTKEFRHLLFEYAEAMDKNSKDDGELLRNISTAISYLLFPLPRIARADVLIRVSDIIFSKKTDNLLSMIDKVKENG